MVNSILIDKRCKKIDTNQLLALCEIKEDYKLFCNDLEELIKSKNNKDLINKVYGVMQKGISISTRKYKTFIEKHHHTIEIMKKYNCLSDFTLFNYNEKGEKKENLAEDYFYNYIQEHNEDIEKIKAVALKIKTLGFDSINFAEEIDFTKMEYGLDTSVGTDFAILENMVVSPAYLNSPIKYKSKNSSYCIYLETIGYGNNKELSMYGKKIELNSLIFNPNRLPSELTIESTIDVIKQLAENKKTEHNDIRDSVDLSITIDDLKNEFERLKKVSEKIVENDDNSKLVKLLNQIQNVMAQLQSFGVNFENQVIDSHAEITKETMEREKKLYLGRRQYIDID